MLPPPPSKLAFSLVELSIVLVILGLLIGGVLSGKSLIRAAEIRAQLAQIDQFRVAARTFREKYFFLPGDLPEPTATSLGLSTRPAGCGDGDGDGLVELWSASAQGETSLFWNDLSKAKLIPGSYTYINGNGNPCGPGYMLPAQTGSAVANYLPPAKLGGGMYVYVWNGGVDKNIWVGDGMTDGLNYFTVAGVTQVSGYSCCGAFGSQKIMKVMDAYVIDSKVDDGKPQFGGVKTIYITGSTAQWTDTVGAYGSNHIPGTGATAGSATTCYDNRGVAGPRSYSTDQNNGEGKNCALSFKM